MTVEELIAMLGNMAPSARVTYNGWDDVREEEIEQDIIGVFYGLDENNQQIIVLSSISANAEFSVR